MDNTNVRNLLKFVANLLLFSLMQCDTPDFIKMRSEVRFKYVKRPKVEETSLSRPTYGFKHLLEDDNIRVLSLNLLELFSLVVEEN